MVCVYRIGDSWFQPQNWGQCLESNCGKGCTTRVHRNTYCTEHLALLTKRSLHSNLPRNHYATQYNPHYDFLPRNHHNRHLKHSQTHIKTAFITSFVPHSNETRTLLPSSSRGTDTHAPLWQLERLSSVTKTNRRMSRHAPLPTKDSRFAQLLYGLISSAPLIIIHLSAPCCFLLRNAWEIRINFS